jgi:hypothetical protein
VIAAQLPVISVSSNGPASRCAAFTMNAGDIQSLRPAGSHFGTSPSPGKKGTGDRCGCRLRRSPVHRALRRKGEVGGLTNGCEGVAIAPALDAAAAVIILAVALLCEALREPKSSKSMPAVLAIATITATITGLRVTFRYLL